MKLVAHLWVEDELERELATGVDLPARAALAAAKTALFLSVDDLLAEELDAARGVDGVLGNMLGLFCVRSMLPNRRTPDINGPLTLGPLANEGCAEAIIPVLVTGTATRIVWAVGARGIDVLRRDNVLMLATWYVPPLVVIT